VLVALALTFICLVLAITAYLALLTAAAIRRPRPIAPVQGGSRTFAVLVPAHNEQEKLPTLVRSLADVNFLADRWSVHLVADNCSDATAEIAAAAGFSIYERVNKDLIGKGYALDFLVERLSERGINPDVYVFLDADCAVSSNLLAAIDARVARGARAIQVRYGVAEADVNWVSALRDLAMRLVNYVRPLGRTRLGGSAGLKGTGMALVGDIVRSQRWGGGLAEDADFHIRLLEAGDVVDFEPLALVSGHFPDKLATASVQNDRWEAGRLAIAKQFAYPLLKTGLKRRDWLLIDACIDLLVPPLSVVALLVLGALAAGILTAPLVLGGAVLATTFLAFHVVVGGIIAGAGRMHAKAVLFAPVFIAWKVVRYLRLFSGGGPAGWQRTKRS
jgi:1,2-diacylglycerol 3-beta-glucosyltransferase